MRLYKIVCENSNKDVTALQYNRNKRTGGLIDGNTITQHQNLRDAGEEHA